MHLGTDFLRIFMYMALGPPQQHRARGCAVGWAPAAFRVFTCHLGGAKRAHRHHFFSSGKARKRAFRSLVGDTPRGTTSHTGLGNTNTSLRCPLAYAACA